MSVWTGCCEGEIMSLKTFSLYKEFLNFLGGDAVFGPKYAQIGDLRLTFRLINTPRLSSESKLIYAYLFARREDGIGCRIPAMCEDLSMTPAQVHRTLEELESKNHIKLITALRNDDLSIFAYYYAIVDPAKYGMFDVEYEQYAAYWP